MFLILTAVAFGIANYYTAEAADVVADTGFDVALRAKFGSDGILQALQEKRGDKILCREAIEAGKLRGLFLSEMPQLVRQHKGLAVDIRCLEAQLDRANWGVKHYYGVSALRNY